MDTAHWPQVGSSGVAAVKLMEGHGHGSSSSPSTTSSSSTSKGLLERKVKPQKDQALNCPRCNSTNTKFCYYNNYSLSQPRYFCKACRRYWTEGGSLRNVPVGGGSRKNKRSSISSNNSNSSSSSSSDKKMINVISNEPSFSQNPKIHHGQDLNLAIFPPTEQDYIHQNPNNTSSSSSSVAAAAAATDSHLSAMELLKSGMASRGLTSFMSNIMPPVSHSSNSTSLYNTSGFPNLHEFKPSLNFSLEGFESGYGGLHQGGQEETGITTNGQQQQQLMFPIQDLKQVSNTNPTVEFVQNRGHGHGDSGGYWNGMLGGGSW